MGVIVSSAGVIVAAPGDFEPAAAVIEAALFDGRYSIEVFIPAVGVRRTAVRVLAMWPRVSLTDIIGNEIGIYL